MIRRLLSALAMIATVALVLWRSALPLDSQAAAAPPLMITAYNGGPPINYTVPRMECSVRL